MTLSAWTVTSGTFPLGTMKYNEYIESGDVSIGVDQSSAVATYQIDGSELLTFMDELIGYATYADEGTSDFTINRVLPEEHPVFDNFYAQECNVKFMGTASVGGTGDKQSVWEVAHVTTNFRPVEYAVVADADISTELDRYCIRRYNYVVEQLTVQGLMQFVQRAKNKALDTAPGFAQIYLEKEITWKLVPAKSASPYEIPNIATILSLAGKVNSSTFDGHAAGTVLFAGVVPVFKTPKLGDGQIYWDLTYRFLIKDNGSVDLTSLGGTTEEAGQNFIYDTLLQRYDLITSDGTISGKRVYQIGDLNQLFVIS